MSFCLAVAKHPLPAFLHPKLVVLPLDCFKDKNLSGRIDSEDLPSDSFLIKSGLGEPALTAGSSAFGQRGPRSGPDPSIFIPVNYAVSELHIFISNVGSVPKYFPKSQ